MEEEKIDEEEKTIDMEEFEKQKGAVLRMSAGRFSHNTFSIDLKPIEGDLYRIFTETVLIDFMKEGRDLHNEIARAIIFSNFEEIEEYVERNRKAKNILDKEYEIYKKILERIKREGKPKILEGDGD